MNGIICIDKPQGFTSFDVVAKLRGIARMKKIGHAGTLDPMATGVLPVFFGNATRACDILPGDQKRYTAQFQLGVETDTQDITGSILRRMETNVTKDSLEQVLASFLGDIKQIPPMYSAVKVAGRRLYDLAREGHVVERKPRPVRIDELRLLSFDEVEQSGVLDVLCSRGTYIRTLVHDMGQALGACAVLMALRRTQSSCFTLSDCLTLAQVQQLGDEGRLEQALLPVEQVFNSYPTIRLSRAQSDMYMNGVRLDLRRVQHENKSSPHRVFDMQGRFLGLGRVDFDAMELAVSKMFIGRDAYDAGLD